MRSVTIGHTPLRRHAGHAQSPVIPWLKDTEGLPTHILA